MNREMDVWPILPEAQSALLTLELTRAIAGTENGILGIGRNSHMGVLPAEGSPPRLFITTGKDDHVRKGPKRFELTPEPRDPP